jgi:hypothetical protein
LFDPLQNRSIRGNFEIISISKMQKKENEVFLSWKASAKNFIEAQKRTCQELFNLSVCFRSCLGKTHNRPDPWVA